MSEEEEVTDELPEITDAVVGATETQPPACEVGANLEDLGLVLDVPLRLSVELGSASMPVREVLALTKGSVVELDRMNGEPADVYVNDRLIARGELTVQDDRVAVRITEVIAAKGKTAIN